MTRQLLTTFVLLAVFDAVLGADKKAAPAKPKGSPRDAAKSAESAAQKTATVEEAAKILDLRTFPRLEGATLHSRVSLSNLSYDAKATVKEAFEFQRRKLAAQKWKELPGGYQADESASGAFPRDGHRLSVSVSPASGEGKAGMVNVFFFHHGNVDPARLPRPAGVKPFYSTPVTAAYLTEAPALETAAEVRKLLLAQGWEPYGSAGESQDFKQNAIKVSARVSAPPSQPGKTAIDYSTELMVVDLPAPQDALRVQYSHSPAQVAIDSADDMEAVAGFYREALAKRGWKATSDKLIKINFEYHLIFRNKEKDLIEIEMRPIDEDQVKTRALVQYQTAAEVDEDERKIKEEQARREKEKNKPKPKIAVTIPAGADDIEATAGRIEFTLAAGKARAAIDALRKQLKDAGWKEEDDPALEKMFGEVKLTKEKQSISLNYIETGLLPAEITISAFGVELEPGKKE